ncbi:putative arabinosyltransferase AftB, partial [Mycobacterium avium MAV_120709_2344]
MMLVAAAPGAPALIVAAGGALRWPTRSSGWATTACWCRHALAKDAAGQVVAGMTYLSNFDAPYLVWVPRAAGAARCCWRAAAPSFLRPAGANYGGRRRCTAAGGGGLVLVSGLLQACTGFARRRLHARRVLLRRCSACCPVPSSGDGARRQDYSARPATGGRRGLRAVAGDRRMALWAANSPAWRRRHARHLLRDRRRTPLLRQATGHAHPLTAADYLGYPRMAAILTALNNTPEGALLLPSGNYTQWDLVPMAQPPPGTTPDKFPQKPQHTVFFTNLGMVGMNVGLDVRVIDQIGLANPLAQHTERLKHGRIGHDKNLFRTGDRDGPWVKVYPGIPGYLDAQWSPRPSRAAMPGHPGGAGLGAGPDDPAPVPVQRAALLPVHRLPDRPGAALRARPLRAAGARGSATAAARVSAAQKNFRPIRHRPGRGVRDKLA